MSDNIIDVEPVAHSSEKAQQSRKTPSKGYYTYQPNTASNAGNRSGQAAQTSYHSAPPASSAQPKSKLGGLGKLAAGGVCTLVGIPMLVLPGPGLLAIGGGIALMASGAKDLSR